MDLKKRIIVVTGAASGIGRELARRFKKEGAKLVVCSDRNGEGAEAVAKEIGGVAFTTDVGKEEDIRDLIETVEADVGPIDLFCSNAGIGVGGGAEASNEAWQRIWDINVMAHVWAARALLPGWTARGHGYLVSTASAAGLLTQVSALGYSITKHAAVALAEWLSIAYADAGIRVSCLCPQAVRTPMLDVALEDPVGAAPLVAGGVLEPADVAEAVVAGIRDERFLILPHQEVAKHLALKGAQPERWLNGMRRLVRQARAQTPPA